MAVVVQYNAGCLVRLQRPVACGCARRTFGGGEAGSVEEQPQATMILQRLTPICPDKNDLQQLTLQQSATPFVRSVDSNSNLGAHPLITSTPQP